MRMAVRSLSVLLVAVAAAPVAAQKTGAFEGQTDVGNPQKSGGAEVDEARGEYTVSGGGFNMWGAADAFHYVWRRISGDVTVTAEVRLEGAGVNAHRKAGWMIRQSLDADAPYADVVVHGDGLTSLQYREAAGVLTKEVRANVSAARTLRLERRGNTFTMWVAREGETLEKAGSISLTLKDPVYVGVAVCSHDDNVIERAVFSQVKVETR